MKSGLKLSTLKKYAKSNCLERADDGLPIYFHRKYEWYPCGFCCNGVHGFDIATDIENIEKEFLK